MRIQPLHALAAAARFLWTRLGPPSALRQRIRWLFLADGLWGFNASLFLVASGPWDNPFPRALAVAGILVLAAGHIMAYRRGYFPKLEFLAEGLLIGWAGGQLGDVHQATPLLYPPLFFRALYGSVYETAGTIISYMAAYYGAAVLWPTYRGQPPLDQQEMIPNMIGMFMVGVMTYVVSITSQRHERAAQREQTLARAGAALVAATDPEQVGKIAVQAVSGLIADHRMSRVGLALLHDDDEAAIVAVEGINADEALGARFRQSDMPDEYRLYDTRKMITIDSEAARLEEVFGFALHPGTLTLTPLMVKDKSLGVLAVESRTKLPDESAVALAALATEVALALDLQRQAFYDSLTKLANRSLFVERARQAIARANADGSSLTVLFLDLDDFKIINDSLGHAAGDELLLTVARRLRACAPPNATVARLGGDEFTVLLENREGAEVVVETLADRITAELQEPVCLLDAHHVSVSASIGIATYHGGTLREPGELLRAADLALYAAKDRGKAQAAVFDPAMGARAMERLELQAELRDALERDEFEVHYQPLVNLRDGQFAEFEALVRWRHPVRGLVPPDRFIPLAEQTGHIVELGQWVLETACKQARTWQADGVERVMCVNLSARQLAHTTLVDDVARALQESGLEPRLLRLEITERIAVDNNPVAHDKLRALHALGVQLAIDDFGTGNSALAYLLHFPVHTLKIDRSFIADLGRDERTTAMVEGIIALAKSMGLSVTAEGIETVEQSGLLRKMGCDAGQGFLFARPARPEQLADLLNGEAASLSHAA